MIRFRHFKNISAMVDFMNERKLTKENVIWMFERDYGKLGWEYTCVYWDGE